MFEHAFAIHFLWIVLSILFAFAMVKLYTLASALNKFVRNVFSKSTVEKTEKSEGVSLDHHHALESH